MLPCLLALVLVAEAEERDVTEPHGPTHEVALDLTEGTWMSVSVHGDRVAFDLLGDLWTVPLSGGEATRLTSDAAWDGQPRFSPDGHTLAYVSDRGGNEAVWLMNADGTDPRPLIEDETARFTQPVWDPSGEWLVVRKRTVDTRSIGVTELWQVHVEGGTGFPLTTLDEHPHAGEQVVTDEHVWFSSRFGRFEYNQDPVAGLWRIVRLNRETGEVRPIAHGAGSASRPLLHPDGRTLLFVSRDRERTVLEALDLTTGRRRVVADWLSPDLLEGFALHATYPSMAFTDDGHVVLWAHGKLWRLDPQTGERAEIPFRARGTWRLHDVQRPRIDIPDQVQARVIRWPTLSARGTLAFSALGALWVRTTDGALHRISDPATGPATGYAPAWSADGDDLAWTSWSDEHGGRLHITPVKGHTETLPIQGQLLNPAFSEDGDQLVVLRGVGGGTSPDLIADPWYEIVLLTRDRKRWNVDVIGSTDNRGPRAPRLHLRDGRVWFLEDRPDRPRTPSKTALVSMKLDGTDRRDHLTLPGAEEIALSPDLRWIAWKQAHQLHVAPLPRWAAPVETGGLPTETVTRIVGDWVGFTPESGAVTWVDGPVFKQLALSELFADAREGDAEDIDPLADPPGTVALLIGLVLPRARPDGVLALTNARVITMNGDEVLESATILIEGDRIQRVDASGQGAPLPVGATVVNLRGRTVIPGLIDVHAHLHFTAGDILPEQEWRYQTALDFGITTVHDPSAFTDVVFTQAERVEAGFMDGPRVLSTGGVLYGALSNSNAETPTLDAARAHVRRLKAVGARSVKVYQQGQRLRRQFYVQACAEEQVLCISEGGGDLWQDLGMVADGFHAVEHSLPMAPVHPDVQRFWAGSPAADQLGTAYTPTLQVAYGGLSGENWFLQHADPYADRGVAERLLRHTPRRELDRKLWRRNLMARDGDWRFRQVAADAAEMADQGVLVTLGAHGELQGLGVHWELWAMGASGAMSPHEALRAATLDGARYLGLDHELGSVAPGKLADLVVLDGDPLQDLRNTVEIDLVIKNGAVWR